MTPSKQQRLVSALNTMELKVLEAVPIQDAWTMTQIVGELKRKGQNSDHKVVKSCLSALLESGLIREPMLEVYTRVEVKQPIKTEEAMNTTPTLLGPSAKAKAPKPVTATPPTTPTDTLSQVTALSQRLRATAKDLVNIAELIDDFGIEIEERLRTIDADSQKLAQLKDILKSL